MCLAQHWEDQVLPNRACYTTPCPSACSIQTGLLLCSPAAGLPASSVKPLQLIQNASARVVFNEPKRAHVTPLLTKLHWLPVATDVCPQNNHWHCSLLPKLITSDLCAIQKCALCYSECRLVVPSQRGTKFLSRTFTMTVPCWWNDLPNSTRATESVTTFKKLLKTYLF